MDVVNTKERSSRGVAVFGNELMESLLGYSLTRRSSFFARLHYSPYIKFEAQVYQVLLVAGISYD